jgi:hypothetical protein
MYSESVHKFSRKDTNIEHINRNECNRMIMHILTKFRTRLTHHDSTSDLLEKKNSNVDQSRSKK